MTLLTPQNPRANHALGELLILAELAKQKSIPEHFVVSRLITIAAEYKVRKPKQTGEARCEILTRYR